ncbi:MAG: phosphotransferase [Thermoplasmata archaeon]|jgi:Ser/Thr protein kinase RdoA (MazF antagonist)|nr:phosphotransferase [Thermoplasmata archaeon]
MSSVLRPVHPIGSTELLEHVREAYSVGGVELTMDLGGSRNHSLLVTTGSGMLVIRVYRAGMSLDRLAAIQLVRRTLGARGVPTSVAYRARSGELWSRHEGQIIEVEDYVEHSSQLDTWSRLEIALPILGRVHNTLRTLSPSPASKKPVTVNYPTTAEVQEWTPRALKRIESWPLLPEQIELVRSAEFLARRLQELDDPLRGTKPIQLVHGNFWGSSVLFRSGKVVLVTDLDFMAERPRVEDLALTLYFASSTLAKDPSSDRTLRRLRGLVDAYDAQLEERLSPIERRALPLAIARAPLAVMQYIAQSERTEEAQHLLRAMRPDLTWAAAIVADIGHWQQGFS